MSKLGPKQVAEEILSKTLLDAPPRSLEEIILEVVSRLASRTLDHHELSARWHKPIRQYIQLHWDECFENGRQPKIAFNSSSDYMIQGPCYIQPYIDSESIKEQKRQRLHWLDYYSALKRLTPREFEVLCKQTLGLLGVQDPCLTSYVGDEGIDFFGRLSMGDL